MKLHSLAAAAAWLGALVLAPTALPVLAQSTPAASAAPRAPTSAPASAAKKQLVQKVLQLQRPGIESFASTVVVEQPVAQMLQSAGQALQAQPADKRQALAQALEADARKYVEDVGPGVRRRAVELAPQTIGPVLEERMTEAELTTLVAWLESPVSRKFGQIQGELQRALGEKLVAESRPTVEPKLRALQQTMAARLGATVAPAPASGNPSSPR